MLFGCSGVSRATRLRALAARGLVAEPLIRALDPFARRRLRHMGLQIVHDPSVVSTRTRAEIFWGIYERPEVSFIRQFLQGSHHVVELGAGLGVSSAHIAAGMGHGGQLICVEANHDFLPLVARNAGRYARCKSVDLIVRNASIGADGHESLFYLDENSAESRVIDECSDAAPPISTRPVPGCTLHSLVNEFGLVEFDLVSDVEGAEVAFILGDGPTGLERCRRMVIELHNGVFSGARVHEETLLDALRQRWRLSVLARKGRVAALARS